MPRPTPVRYVVVSDDPENKVILSGPTNWGQDGPTWDPEEGHWMLESEALAAGYTYP